MSKTQYNELIEAVLKSLEGSEMSNSTQLKMVKQIWNEEAEFVTLQMLELAKDSLSSEFVFNDILSGEFFFEPFTEANFTVEKNFSENGTEDDVCAFISSVWIHVLTNCLTPELFTKLVKEISNVQVNGL